MSIDKTKLFIKCDCCGEKIKYGDTAYVVDGYCGIYHSEECGTEYFGRAYLDEVTVDNKILYNCQAKIYSETSSEANPLELELHPVYEPYTDENGRHCQKVTKWKWNLKGFNQR